MRQLIIKSLDILLWVIAGILILASLIFGYVNMYKGGPLIGLLTIVAGIIYTLFVTGSLLLGIGVSHNTRRTALALEELLKR